MSNDPFIYKDYNGVWRVHEFSPEDEQWRIHLRNRLRLAELEERRLNSPLNDPEFQAQAEVRR